MKTCTKCKESKPLEAFSKDANGKLGRRAACKDCMNAHSRLQYAKGTYKATSLRYYFNIDVSEYERMLLDQDGCCLICKRTFDEKLVPHIDHDWNCCPQRRSCGRCIRGLLCKPCNGKLSVIEDKQWVDSAREYLVRWNFLNERLQK